MTDRRKVALHVSAPPFEDDDGWYWSRCECNYEQGPFPDMETAIDDLMQHAREQALIGNTGGDE